MDFLMSYKSEQSIINFAIHQIIDINESLCLFMRTSTPNKFFSDKIKSILHGLKNHRLSFTELLQICAKNYIKFSSRQQIQVLKQQFNQSSTQIQASTLFTSFQLLKVQTIQSRKYLQAQIYYSVIKVKWISPIQQNFNFSPIHIHHQFQKCIVSFFEAMRKCYGTEANWFKSLGGLTIAISLSSQSLMKGIQRAMKGTAHSNCCHLIFHQFFKQNTLKSIHWLTFMNTVKRLKQIIKLRIKQAQVQEKIPKYLEKGYSEFLKKSNKKNHFSYSFDENQDCRGLSLEFKKCKLYTKQDFFDGLSFVKMRKTDNLFRKRSFSTSSKLRAKTSMSQQQKCNISSNERKKNKSIIISTSNVKVNELQSVFFPTQAIKDDQTKNL